MSDKENLKNMLDNLINDKAEDAQVNFHSYLQSKMQDVLGNEVPPTDAPSDEKNTEE